MKIGFTGSRNGMTAMQRVACFGILRNLILSASGDEVELHHGDCVGSDFIVHSYALDTLPIKIVVHPPDINRFRAFSGRGILTSQHDKVVCREPKSYFTRNRDIIDETDILVATPATEEEKGGTWYTINWARKSKRHIWIIMPDGEIRRED